VKDPRDEAGMKEKHEMEDEEDVMDGICLFDQ
jgi:hypothetical protein